MNLIDDHMIIEAYQESSNYQEEQRDIKQQFKKIISLQFSYKSIYKINGLRGLDSLQILKLDNNFIEKIENLQELKNLKSLDLSFNHIKNVENLNQLNNLEDLSLYHNYIEFLDYSQFSNLKKLNLLSLSHNQISDVMALIKALIPISSLQVLTISNNPLTSEPDYKQYLFKNLPQLKYLDYAFIDDKERQEINDQLYQQDFNSDMGKQNKKQDRDIIHDSITLKLNQYHLTQYDSYLLQGNQDLNVLLQIKNAFEESQLKLNENVKGMLENLKIKVSEEFQKKSETMNKFESAYDRMIQESENESQNFIRDYLKEKKHLMLYIYETQNLDKKFKIEQIYEYLSKLEEKLVEQEMILKNRLTFSYQKLEKNLKEIYDTLQSNLIGEQFGIKQVDGFIVEFFSKFQEEAIVEAEKYQQYIENHNNGSQQSLSNEDEILWTEEQENLLIGTDELKNTITTIKESVENKHRNVESIIQKDVQLEKTNYLERVKKNIKELNRKNVYNIILLIQKEDKYWKDIEITFNQQFFLIQNVGQLFFKFLN